MVPDTLRIGLEKVSFPSPTQVTDDPGVLTLKSWVFEPLLKWNLGGLAGPALFDRWEHFFDGREWHFHVREDAVFHDGEACVARHIVDFISSILDSKDTFGMRWSYHRYLANAKISANDDRTVRVQNPEPIADILDIFTEFYICRVAKDGKPVLGTGYYRVSEFDAEEGRATLDYTGKTQDRGHWPQRIIATAEPIASKRLELLAQGNLDIALNVERSEQPLKFEKQFQWGKATNTLSIIYYLNCQKGIFTMPEARLAINHALDKSALVREVFHGLAAPASTVVSPYHLGARQAALDPIPYDVEKARELLSGSDLSTPIILRTPTRMPDHAEAITQFVVRSLEAVGVKVIVEVEADRPAYARQVGHDKRIGDMSLFDSSPHSTYRVLSDKISSINQAVWWQGYASAEVDELIKLANSAVRDSDREDAYARCLIKLRDDPPWLFIGHPTHVFAAKIGQRGLSLDCKGVLNIR